MLKADNNLIIMWLTSGERGCPFVTGPKLALEKQSNRSILIIYTHISQPRINNAMVSKF